MSHKKYAMSNTYTKKLYSYVVVSDSGFAPNPFGGYGTLACCKPKIRQRANVGEWIVGTGSKRNVGTDKLIYAMEVTEKITFERYANDERFTSKIPSKGVIEERGDNIYYRNTDGTWIQRLSYHSKDKMAHDLSGMYVLISDRFFYFGRDAVAIPERFHSIIKKGPWHKNNFDDELIEKFITWVEGAFTPGVHGAPYIFTTKFLTLNHVG